MRGFVGPAAAVVTFAVAGSAQASDILVSRTGDTPPNGCNQGGCTLREAVIAANNKPGADLIQVRPGKTYTLTIPGTGEDESATGDLDINGPVEIRHRNRRRATIDGSGLDGVIDATAETFVEGMVVRGGTTFGIQSTRRVYLRRSTITGNDGYGVQSQAPGGPIRLEDSRITGNAFQGIQQNVSGGVTLIRSSVSGNDAQGIQQYGAGGVEVHASRVTGNEHQGIQEYDGGGVVLTRGRVTGNGAQGIQEYDPGKVVLRRGTASGNSSQGIQTYDAGGLTIKRGTVANNGSQGVQVYDAGAAALLDRAVISGNTFRGIEISIDGTYAISRSTIAGNGGGVYLAGDSSGRLTASTISDNRTTGDGGGIQNLSTLVVRNTTIASNRAAGTGGGIDNGGTLRLNNVTVTRNVADANNDANGLGGGLFNGLLLSSTRISNSIVALNDQLGGTADDCWGAFDSRGGTLLTDDTDCGGFEDPGDIVRTNPKLGSLKRNGGPTKTIALKKGSPAIGNARKGSAEKRDQRGPKRDGDPDSGAFER
jgi:Right handed beta helix region